MTDSLWRWFPHALIGTMAIVFAVNIWMVVLAVQGFPGAAGRDGFDLSNNYDHIIDAAAAQSALGWTIDATTDGARHPQLRITAPRDAIIEAHAERPVGDPQSTLLAFHEINGIYASDTTLFSGQWDLLLTIKAQGKTFSTTRRLVIQ